MAQTLTAQSSVLGPGPLDASGDPQLENPPTSHFASEEGNSGQLSYRYPLQLPPGSGGFVPQLALTSSSSDPNERHYRTSPANNVGDGWSLTLGSINATGACTSGAHPSVQNTYDTSKLTVAGTTDYPIGRLTQSVATTSFPDGSSLSVTEPFEHDARGRLSAEQLHFGSFPSGWNVTTPLPTYQVQDSYNDADQLTSTNPTGQGYTATQVYDSTGALYGLSNTGNATANLATVVYNARAQLDTIAFQTRSSSALATEQFGYDANLRLTSTTASWQSGSGSSGTLFSQNRSYDPAGNVISLATTQAAVPGQSGSGGSETQNFCYDEQNRLVWAGNSGTQPAAGNGTCGTGTPIPTWANCGRGP